MTVIISIRFISPKQETKQSGIYKLNYFERRLLLNPKIEKLEKDIEKTTAKIAELQKKVRDMQAQKTELENADYVATCRSFKLTPAQLAEFLKTHHLPQETEDDYED